MTSGTEVLELRAFGAQHDFLVSDVPFLAFIGGRGSGKTMGGAMRTLRLIGEGAKNLIATAPTFPMLRDSTLKTCLEVWPGSLIKDFSKTEMKVSFRCGAQVIFRSTDDPEHLRGPNTGVVWMDEAALSPLEAWLILLGTLREAPGRGFLTTTPKGFNWIYQEFVAKGRADYQVIHGRSDKNKHNPPQFLQALRESYEADFALQEIEGQFVSIGGGCYFDVTVLERLLKEAIDSPVFRPYVAGRRYAAGLDPAGLGQDAHSFSILDCQTGDFVVDYTTREAPGEFGLKAYKLGSDYQFPLLVVENNGVGLNMVTVLLGLGWPREKLVYQDEEREKPGMPMTESVRSRILVNFAEGVRQGSLRITSRKAIDEMFSFVKSAKTSPKAAQGAHDDRVMAMAWANWCGGRMPASVRPVQRSFRYATA